MSKRALLIGGSDDGRIEHQRISAAADPLTARQTDEDAVAGLTGDCRDCDKKTTLPRADSNRDYGVQWRGN